LAGGVHLRAAKALPTTAPGPEEDQPYTFWTFPDRIQRVHTFTCRFFPWSKMRIR
jgi:hypothetical protein